MLWCSNHHHHHHSNHTRRTRHDNEAARTTTRAAATAGLVEDDLPRCYETYCDPRLNYSQAMEAALRVARELKQ